MPHRCCASPTECSHCAPAGRAEALFCICSLKIVKCGKRLIHHDKEVGSCCARAIASLLHSAGELCRISFSNPDNPTVRITASIFPGSVSYVGQTPHFPQTVNHGMGAAVPERPCQSCGRSPGESLRCPPSPVLRSAAERRFPHPLCPRITVILPAGNDRLIPFKTGISRLSTVCYEYQSVQFSHFPRILSAQNPIIHPNRRSVTHIRLPRSQNPHDHLVGPRSAAQIKSYVP